MNLEQIDTSTTAGKAEVMRLAAEGRRVAMRSLPGAHPMNAVDVNLYPWVYSAGVHPSWNWTQCDYAILAEPVGSEEVWVLQRHGDPICVYSEEKDGTIRYIRADLAGEKG